MKKFGILFLLLAILVALTVFVSCNNEASTDESCFVFYPLDDDTYAVACDIELVKYLTKIVIPAKHNGKKVSTIAEYGFVGCDNLKTIIIPNSVVSIGKYSFYNCHDLTSIIIPNSVKIIEEHAFDSCSSLESIVISNNVTSIGENAFYRCTKLSIYCEAQSEPDGWSSNWNKSNRPVEWGYKK